MEKREFTSRLSPLATVLVLLWLPMHVYGLPWLLVHVGGMTDYEINFVSYAVGAVYLVAVGFSFLRRDFDVLVEQPLRVLFQVAGCYGAMLLMNMAVGGLLSFFTDPTANPNNEAVMELVSDSYGKMSAAAIFLAPIVEEMLFRAGIFSTLRHKSRWLAYLVTILLFGIYHVWGYALNDPMSWLYLVQYVPAGYLLCRCYEYSDSLWGSIFFHMLTNFVSLQLMQLAKELL